MLCGLGRTETDVGHDVHSLEASSHSVVNTFRLPPVAGQLLVSITLMAGEFLRPLLDDFGSGGWSDRHFHLKVKI